ncbi:hypothetical protein CSOJ01_12805 [Colletotrichum sojae]|uniref:Uncharacterized protein n=1 Tax=Colletotrichum sojae TaxID=2175907 RepID=A0A8H6ITW8_9PEZI|nr:hypothetical protein CSOJ01_12805 [Colletotrichum sojae]
MPASGLDSAGDRFVPSGADVETSGRRLGRAPKPQDERFSSLPISNWRVNRRRELADSSAVAAPENLRTRLA